MSIKPTSAKAAEYVEFARRCLDLKSTGTKAIVDGQYTIICRYTPTEAVLIALARNAIISHPRSGALTPQLYANGLPPAQIVKGGWDSSLKALDTAYVYPILDDGKGAALIEQGPRMEFSGSDSGNIYAVNPQDTDEVVSWKGPPARHIPINQTGYRLSGIDTTDESSSFTSWIYQGGERYLQAPRCNDYKHALTGYTNEYGLVLGCGFHNNNLLIVVAHTIAGTLTGGGALDTSKPYGPHVSVWVNNRAAAALHSKNSDNTKVGGWERLAIAKWGAYPYQTVPWSFNATGTAAVSSNGDSCAISYANGQYSATLKIVVDSSGNNALLVKGQRTITGESVLSGNTVHSARNTVFARQEEHKFFGYYGDDLLHMAIKVNSFLMRQAKDTGGWNTERDTLDIRVPKLPNGAEVVVTNNKYVSVYLTLDGKPWGLDACPPQCSITVSGPMISGVLMSENGCSGEIQYTDGGDPACWPPKQPGEAENWDYTATATIMGMTVSKSWTVYRSQTGTTFGYYRCNGAVVTFCPTGGITNNPLYCAYPLQGSGMSYSGGSATFYSGDCPTPPSGNTTTITWTYICCATGSNPADCHCP